MGFWDGLSKAFGRSHKAVNSTVAGPMEQGAGAVARGVGKVTSATGTVVGGTTGAVTGAVTGALKPFKKPLVIGGVVLGVAAITGIAAHYLRKGRKADKPLPAPEMDMVPPMPTMDMMAQQPGTMMGMQPTPGEHAQRVVQGRGVGGQGLGA
jgi:hypothetical protein